MSRRTKSQELLDFEIHFYEKLLTAYPDFVDVLIPLGTAYTKRGFFEKGLAIDLRLIQLRSEDALTWYNLACSYSLLGHIEDALAALQRAFELGYRDMTFLQNDPDLAGLRQSSKFREWLSSLAAAKAAAR